MHPADHACVGHYSHHQKTTPILSKTPTKKRVGDVSTYRVTTKRPILIRQLRQPSPTALLDHLLTPMQPRRDLLKSFDLLFPRVAAHEVELQECAQEEAGRPQPLRSLVVGAAFRRGEVVRVVGVEIPGVVFQIAWIKGRHAGRTAQILVCHLEGYEGMLGIEEVGGDSHGDWEVRAELVIAVLLLALVDILVDAPTG